MSKSAIGKTVIWVEDTLIKSGLFALPSKRVMQKADTDIEIVLIDVTEQPIERPKKGQKKWYSGKKKCHTIKILSFADASDDSVIAIAQHKRSTHDFRIFKENFEGADDKIKFLADSGFQGILEFHSNSEMPVKSSNKHKPTEEEKRYNHERHARTFCVKINFQQTRILLDRESSSIAGFTCIPYCCTWGKVAACRYDHLGSPFAHI